MLESSIVENLKVNETIYVLLQNSVLTYEGTITKIDNDNLYIKLEELTGWGENIENTYKIDEFFDEFSDYNFTEYYTED